MNPFEKILERLDESQKIYDDIAFVEMNENGHTLDSEYARGEKDSMDEAIEIVQEVAEEYNGGWIPCSGCKDCKNRECEHYGKV